MKKIITFIVLTVLMVSCTSNNNKYTIEDVNGVLYGTNSYTIREDGCIQFKDIQCGCSDELGEGIPVIICGSYTITENKVNN